VEGGNVADKWYVEWYADDGIKAKELRYCHDFGEVLACIKALRENRSTDVLRVLAPTSAISAEIQELKAHGATLL
jgi:hypothetical protein